MKVYVLSNADGQGGSPDIPVDVQQSPISDAHGWANAPEAAKEFVILFGGGLLRRPALILKK